MIYYLSIVHEPCKIHALKFFIDSLRWLLIFKKQQIFIVHFNNCNGNNDGSRKHTLIHFKE